MLNRLLKIHELKSCFPFRDCIISPRLLGCHESGELWSLCSFPPCSFNSSTHNKRIFSHFTFFCLRQCYLQNSAFIYNSFLFIAVAGLLNSLKTSLPVEISNLMDPVKKMPSMQMNMWTMIVRPNILSTDIIVNASSQTEFLYQLEALFLCVCWLWIGKEVAI